MSQQQRQIMAAQAALKYLPANSILGIGTGELISYIINLLIPIKTKIKAIVASSNNTTRLLQQYDFPVVELTAITTLSTYIDQTHAYNKIKQSINNTGTAITTAKILASIAEQFIALTAQTNIDTLTACPIPIEVLPSARSFVAREIIKLGGQPQLRPNVITENANNILDLYHLNLEQPIKLEQQLKNIPGVVASGLFAQKTADLIIIGKPNTVTILK